MLPSIAGGRNDFTTYAFLLLRPIREYSGERVLWKRESNAAYAGLAQVIGTASGGGKTDALPDDYKEFLTLTNGRESLCNGFYGEPKRHSARDVCMVDATEQQQAQPEVLHGDERKSGMGAHE
jgi:hypothetical protein